MILSAQSIRARMATNITPFCERSVSPSGLSFGLGPCGYDIRIDRGFTILSRSFCLAGSLEHFSIPEDLVMLIKDKSTWARRGLFVQNTVAEPGWKGYLTLELSNDSMDKIRLEEGDPIAQVLFLKLDQVTEQPYTGKYQHQQRGPQPALREAILS